MFVCLCVFLHCMLWGQATPLGHGSYLLVRLSSFQTKSIHGRRPTSAHLVKPLPEASVPGLYLVALEVKMDLMDRRTCWIRLEPSSPWPRWERSGRPAFPDMATVPSA